MGILHLTQLGHGAVDALQPRLQQQPQGAGAAAFLQGLAPGFQPGDLPLQVGLLLLQSLAGALLQCQRLHQLLGLGLLGLEGVQQQLPLLLQLAEGAGHPLAVGGVLLQLLAQFRQAFLLLAPPLTQLLLLRQSRGHLPLQLLALAAALFLLLEPAAAAAGHLAQPPAREFHGGLGGAAIAFGLLEAGAVVRGGQFPLLLTQVALLARQLVALALQLFGTQLVLLGLARQFAAPGLQACQFRLHGQQAVFTEGLHLGLQQFEGLGGLLQGGAALAHRRAIGVLLFGEGLLAALEAADVCLGLLEAQHLLLQAAQVVALLKALIGAGLGAVPLQFLARDQQLLLHDGAALFAFLHLLELAAGLFDAGIEQGHPGQFIDQAPPVAGTHRHDAGHVALHHHVAALGIHPQAPQLGLQLLEVAGHTFRAVAAAVGAAWGHPQLAGHAPFLLARLNPGALRRRLQPGFGLIGPPVAEVKAHGHHGFRGLAIPQHGAVHEVGQALGPHAAAVGQAQAEEHPIEDVALARSVGACHHRETRFEGDGHRPPERLEMRERYLIDVNQ